MHLSRLSRFEVGVSTLGTLSAALALVAGVAAVHAQNAPTVEKALYSAADAIGMLREVDEKDGIARVDFWATGTMTVGGRPFRILER